MYARRNRPANALIGCASVPVGEGLGEGSRSARAAQRALTRGSTSQAIFGTKRRPTPTSTTSTTRQPHPTIRVGGQPANANLLQATANPQPFACSCLPKTLTSRFWLSQIGREFAAQREDSRWPRVKWQPLIAPLASNALRVSRFLPGGASDLRGGGPVRLPSPRFNVFASRRRRADLATNILAIFAPIAAESSGPCLRRSDDTTRVWDAGRRDLPPCPSSRAWLARAGRMSIGWKTQELRLWQP